MANTFELIEAKTLTTSAASITFSSIPATYTDLKVIYSGRDTTDSPGSVYIQFNGAGYVSTTLKINGAGSGTPSSSTHNNAYLGLVPGPSQTANTFGNGEIYIPNYTSSDNKSFSSDVVTENNATTAYQFLWAGLWSSSAVITSVSLKTDQAFTQYSTFYLYGIKNS